MKSKLHVVILIALMAVLALPARAAAAASGEPEAQGVKCPSRVTVTVAALQPAAFSEYARLAAVARPQVVAVASPVAGVLSEIRVSEGSLVDAGQDLAVLNAGMEAKLQALADDAARKKKILTARQNWKEKSEKAIQAAERDYQAALALLEEGKALAGRAVQAPLAGIVRLKAETGAELEAGALLFEIVDPLRLRLEAETGAPQGLFVVGEALEARAEGVEGVFAAEVAAVGDGKVALLLDNRERKLEEGAAVTCAKLKARHEQALLVPAAAVLQDSLGDFVYVAEKKNARKAYVTVSAREEGKAMIEKGLSAGALVIVSGLDCLADNKKIRVANAGETAGAQAQADLKAQQAAAATAAAAGKEEEKKARAEAAAAAKAKEEEEKKAKAEAAAAAKARKEEEKKAKAEEAAAAKAEKKAKAAEAKAMKEEAKQAKTAAKAAACPKRVEVRTETVAPGLFRAYGYFKAAAMAEEVAVAAPEAGWVYALAVSEGAAVSQGDELLTLVVGGSEKSVALRQEVERKAKVLAVRREAQAATRSIQAAERDLQKAVALLEKEIAPYARKLSAPLAGVAMNVQAAPGADAAAAAPLLAIRTDASLRISLALAQAEASGFVVGETLEVRPVGQDVVSAAQVVVADGDGVVLRLDNRDGLVKAGSHVVVRKLSSEHPAALAVPSQAVLNDSLGDFIYVMEKKKARKLYVGAGPSEGGRTLIEKGLPAGAQLIVSGFECLSDKKAVRVVAEPAKEAAGVEPAKALPGREEFMAYLEANREALGYEKYEKSEWKGLPAVRIVSGRETQKKLLDVLPQFAVSAMTFELEGERIVSHVAFAVPGAAPAVAKKEKKPVAEGAEGRFKVGLHGSLSQILGATFKNAYGAAVIGFGGELSFRFADKMDFWVSGGMAAKKATPEWSGDEMTFDMIPLSAAVRYFFGQKGKLNPFVGGGANVFLVKDSSPTGEIDTTLIGPQVLGGFYYPLGRKLSASLLAKFNLLSKDVVPESDLDKKLDLTGLQLLLGLSYSF